MKSNSENRTRATNGTCQRPYRDEHRDYNQWPHGVEQAHGEQDRDIDDQLRHADRRQRKEHQNNDEYPRQHAIGSSDRFFSRSDWLQESIKM
jgi:hypothetical protein